MSERTSPREEGNARPITLYQSEWCPFSAAVREVLTELGLPFVAQQVEAWPEERDELRALAGTDQIPVLLAEDGTVHRGTREIFAHLRERDCVAARGRAPPSLPRPSRRARDRRPRPADRVLQGDGRARGRAPARPRRRSSSTSPSRTATSCGSTGGSSGSPRTGGATDGSSSRTRRSTRLAPGRGFGTQLVLAALEDARRQRLEVVPLCPFVGHVIDEHPEYQDLVAAGYHG